ncbi:hypothetical protein AG4045_026669 [Apium graveolens]|uniref:NAC domain-containing protein n=2 Tax=Apium graveolens TaxID=4045 RepID=A0A6L5B8P7_APIGR|nr:hypothetical protein AG4045_026669 [Apium graveolens]
MKRAPLGVRFCPTDLEAFAYLFSKIYVKHLKLLPLELVQEFDVYESKPCKLPRKEEDEFSYYFTRRTHRSANKIDRYIRDDKGYWRKSGSTKKAAGKKSTLVYHHKSKKDTGKGQKTNWIMHEYELANENGSDRSARSSSRSLVLCRIYERKELEEKEHEEKEIGDQKEDINNELDLPGLLRMLGESHSEVLNRVVEEEGDLDCEIDNNATLPNSPTPDRGASVDLRMSNTQQSYTRNLIQSMDGPNTSVMSIVEETDIDLSLRL